MVLRQAKQRSVLEGIVSTEISLGYGADGATQLGDVAACVLY
jgi:hypothetical protein